MNMMTSLRPHMGEPLIPHVSRPVADRLQSLLIGINALINLSAGVRYPALAGCAVQPYAGFVMTGTSCQRPLLFSEMQQIADMTGFDVVLMRYDADRGCSFDIILQEGDRKLIRYLA